MTSNSTTPKGWALEPQTWSALPAELIGTGWKMVPFAATYAYRIPQINAIYAICSTPPNIAKNSKPPLIGNLFASLHTAIYIGSSSQLKTRFTDHSSAGCMPNIRDAKTCFPGKLEFWFHECPDGKLREWEGKLQECLGPTANRARVTPNIRGRMSGIVNIGTGKRESIA